MKDTRHTYRLQPRTLSQIKELRRILGLNSDARILALAVEYLYLRETKK